MITFALLNSFSPLRFPKQSKRDITTQNVTTAPPPYILGACVDIVTADATSLLPVGV